MTSRSLPRTHTHTHTHTHRFVDVQGGKGGGRRAVRCGASGTSLCIVKGCRTRPTRRDSQLSIMVIRCKGRVYTHTHTLTRSWWTGVEAVAGVATSSFPSQVKDKATRHQHYRPSPSLVSYIEAY